MDSHFKLKAIKRLHREGKYMQYINVVKSEICSMITSRLKEDRNTQEQLWRRLVLTANSFATQLISERKHPQAIVMLEVCNNLLLTNYVQSEDCILELSALVKDSHAYYYSRRGKPSAALQYIHGASSIEKQRGVLDKKHKNDGDQGNEKKVSFNMHLARCHLHRAYILQQLRRFDDAIKYTQRVLAMVDHYLLDDSVDNTMVDDRTNTKAEKEIDTSDPQILVMVAVTYHNIAVMYILMDRIGDACISSQNCRRLCRLCMSVSNRYVSQFEETHTKALCELSSMVRSKQSREEALVFQKLVVELFD